MAALPLRERGFDPVVEGPRLLAQLELATAAPGAVVGLGALALAVRPWRLGPACALLLAVLDDDVTVRVLGPGAETIAEYLRFNSGARSAPVEEADFVLVTGSTSGGQVRRSRRATTSPTRAGAVITYAPERLVAGGGSAPATLLIDAAGRASHRLGVVGIAPEELDDLAGMADAGGVTVWLAAVDGSLAVVPPTVGWRREDA
jgi:hypothetical protein